MTGPGRPRLLSERCATCVFRPGNRMHLAPGRLGDLIRSNLAAGAFLTCHDTLPYGEHPNAGEAMCRGYWDAYRPQVNAGRVMDRLAAAAGGDPQWWTEVPPPGKDTHA